MLFKAANIRRMKARKFMMVGRAGAVCNGMEIQTSVAVFSEPACYAAVHLRMMLAAGKCKK